MHLNSKLIFKKYGLSFFHPGMKILEIGPDSFPSSNRQALGEMSLTWDTLDIADNSDLTFPNSNEYLFDIPNETYDLIISSNVIEHVKKPWKWIPEITRITKSGGRVIIINPVSWIYHESPVDCWRIYPEGMKALYEEAGLDVCFSSYESLETPGFRRYIPGISKENRNPWGRWVNQLLGYIGLPVERAYDNITIGIKK